MKGINTLKNKCLLYFFCSCWWEIFEENLTLSWTKLAKMAFKAFSYCVIPDLSINLRSSKIEQMKGIDAMKKMLDNMFFSFMLVGVM